MLKKHAWNPCYKKHALNPCPPKSMLKTNAVKACLKTCLKHDDNPCPKSMLGMHAVKACLKTVLKKHAAIHAYKACSQIMFCLLYTSDAADE